MEHLTELVSGSVLDPGAEKNQSRACLQGPSGAVKRDMSEIKYCHRDSLCYAALLLGMASQSFENAVLTPATGPLHILFLLGVFSPTHPLALSFSIKSPREGFSDLPLYIKSPV